MVNEPQRKYDVAFSFRAQDLGLAQRLAEKIEPLTSFVYADKQGEIVTKDGMETFSAVFGEQSRLNVVLYREGYGQKGWTNYEQQVIRARCLGNEGWDSFALFSVDGTPVPKWVPATYIYGDLSTMDEDVVAGVIRFRAKTVGADVQGQTPADRLNALVRKKAFADETAQLETGPAAHQWVRDSLKIIDEHVRVFLATHNTGEFPGLAEVGGGGNAYFVNLGRVGFILNYRNQFGGITRGELLLRYFDGPVSIPSLGRSYLDPNQTAHTTIRITRTPALGWAWQLNGKPKTSEEIAERILHELIRLNT
jgi:hypothetical protein